MGDLIFVTDASGKYLVLYFNYRLLNAKSIRRMKTTNFAGKKTHTTQDEYYVLISKSLIK